MVVADSIPSIMGTFNLSEWTRLPSSHVTDYSAAFTYGGGHHAILMTGSESVRFAKVWPLIASLPNPLC